MFSVSVTKGFDIQHNDVVTWLCGGVLFGHIQFLAKSLVAIADDKWSCQLAIEATRYLSTYNQSLEEKVSEQPHPNLSSTMSRAKSSS